MRLLLDENLSPRVVTMLREAGHDAAHVTQVGLGNTDDAEILAAAAGQDRTVVTADTDVGALLTARGTSSPAGSRPGPPPRASARGRSCTMPSTPAAHLGGS
ncbi:MAG: DUF5615 family PIN-like protein [Egibacteraceae bacterium]